MKLRRTSASKFSQRASDAPASVSVLTAEDFRTYGWRTLADALNSVRGFYVTSDRAYSFLGVRGFQPVGEQLGFQGPDQGFALKIAHEMEDSLHLQLGEHAHDAIRGCLGIALRRASMFSRAPVVHDLTIAFTIWGFLNPDAPAELVSERRRRFAGLGHGHHYTEARQLVDMVPESTLRLTPAAAAAAHQSNWKALVGL